MAATKKAATKSRFANQERPNNVSIRFPDGFKDELEAAARSVGLSMNDIAKLATQAAVKAIRENGNRVTLPFRVEFGDER